MISVTILAKNSEATLPQVLDALVSFDEVLLYDTGSTDKTKEIAAGYPNVTLKEGPFVGFGRCHNEATLLAKHDWILSIDSDEVLTQELKKEIEDLKLERRCVYSIPRKNYLNGKLIRYSGWSPDRVFRLYNRQDTSFCESKVHEAVQTKGMKVVFLRNHLLHYSYVRVDDFLKKMQMYSTLFAEEKLGKKHSSPLKAVTHAAFSFFKTYVLQRGFLDGFQGLFIAVYNSNTAFYKYLKLYERQKDSPMA